MRVRHGNRRARLLKKAGGLKLLLVPPSPRRVASQPGSCSAATAQPHARVHAVVPTSHTRELQPGFDVASREAELVP